MQQRDGESSGFSGTRLHLTQYVPTLQQQRNGLRWMGVGVVYSALAIAASSGSLRFNWANVGSDATSDSETDMQLVPKNEREKILVCRGWQGRGWATDRGRQAISTNVRPVAHVLAAHAL